LLNDFNTRGSVLIVGSLYISFETDNFSEQSLRSAYIYFDLDLRGY